MSFRDDLERVGLLCRFAVRALAPHLVIYVPLVWWACSSMWRDAGPPRYWTWAGDRILSPQEVFRADQGYQYYFDTSTNQYYYVGKTEYPDAAEGTQARVIVLVGAFLPVVYVADLLVTRRRRSGGLIRASWLGVILLTLILIMLIPLAFIVLANSPDHWRAAATWFLTVDIVLFGAYLGIIAIGDGAYASPYTSFLVVEHERREATLRPQREAAAARSAAERLRADADARRRARQELTIAYTGYLPVIASTYSPVMLREYLDEYMGDARSVEEVQCAGIRLSHELKDLYFREKPRFDSVERQRKEIAARIEQCNRDITVLRANDEISPYQLQEALDELDREKQQLQDQWNTAAR